MRCLVGARRRSSPYPAISCRGIQGDVNTAPVVSLVVALAAVGCMSTRGGEIAEPVVTMAPDEFVLRDLRREAAPMLGCQVPMVEVHMGAWAGSEGNVVVAGCGYQVTYYLRCLTNHQCSWNITD